MVRLVIILSYILSSFSLVYAKEANQIKIEWKPIAGAHAYTIELKKSKDETIQKTITDHFIYFDLTAGTYEYRVGLTNKLGKTKNFTSWHQLKVYRSKTPFLNPGQETKVLLPHKKLVLLLKGENFMKKTKFIFKNEQNTLPVQEYIRISDKKINIVLELNETFLGKYDVRIVNPYGKEKIYKDFLVLTNRASENDSAELSLFHSLAFPGTGQWYRGNRWWGNILSISTLAFMGSYLYYDQKRENSALAFQENIIALGFLGEDSGVFPSYYFYNKGLQHRNYANRYNQNQNLAAKALIGVYIINTIDVLWHGEKKGSGVFLNYSTEVNHGDTYKIGYTIRF